jgi:hypothetical protein
MRAMRVEEPAGLLVGQIGRGSKSECLRYDGEVHGYGDAFAGLIHARCVRRKNYAARPSRQSLFRALLGSIEKPSCREPTMSAYRPLSENPSPSQIH